MKNILFKTFILSGVVFFGAGCSNSRSNNHALTPTDLFEASGGDLTVYDTSRDAFAHRAPLLSVEEQQLFSVGNAFFTDPWVIAPSSTAGRDGLGPTFNTRSCAACHFKDGRGRPPLEGEEMLSMLIRLSIPGQDSHGANMPDPNYGGQLNPFGITGVPGEGKAHVSYETVSGSYEDGTSYTLLKPSITFSDLQFGALDQHIETSPRTAPGMAGLGLLEAIDAQDILANADEQDTNHDGISGRANYVWSQETQSPMLGRFGWKANQPTLSQQTAGAFLGDMGITSSMNPNNNCPDIQMSCQEAPNGGTPEIADNELNAVIFYARTLAVPARRNVFNATIQHGQQLFRDLNCTGCHIETFKTRNWPEMPVLSNQVIHPYTDLLLHDMGPDLADNRPDFLATGTEWRTPPLWGLGLIQTVNQHTRLMHDGRARNIEEAILHHGGEAQQSKDDFRALSASDRNALIQFLESL